MLELGILGFGLLPASYYVYKSLFRLWLLALANTARQTKKPARYHRAEEKAKLSQADSYLDDLITLLDRGVDWPDDNSKFVGRSVRLDGYGGWFAEVTLKHQKSDAFIHITIRFCEEELGKNPVCYHIRNGSMNTDYGEASLIDLVCDVDEIVNSWPQHGFIANPPGSHFPPGFRI